MTSSPSAAKKPCSTATRQGRSWALLSLCRRMVLVIGRDPWLPPGSMDGRTLDKAVATFDATRCSLRLAVVVGARIPRRPFVVTMPARIEQERHQGDADHQREDYADRHGDIADLGQRRPSIEVQLRTANAAAAINNPSSTITSAIVPSTLVFLGFGAPRSSIRGR